MELKNLTEQVLMAEPKHRITRKVLKGSLLVKKKYILSSNLDDLKVKNTTSGLFSLMTKRSDSLNFGQIVVLEEKSKRFPQIIDGNKRVLSLQLLFLYILIELEKMKMENKDGEVKEQLALLDSLIKKVKNCVGEEENGLVVSNLYYESDESYNPIFTVEDKHFPNLEEPFNQCFEEVSQIIKKRKINIITFTTRLLEWVNFYVEKHFTLTSLIECAKKGVNSKKITIERLYVDRLNSIKDRKKRNIYKKVVEEKKFIEKIKIIDRSLPLNKKEQLMSKLASYQFNANDIEKDISIITAWFGIDVEKDKVRTELRSNEIVSKRNHGIFVLEYLGLEKFVETYKNLNYIIEKKDKQRIKEKFIRNCVLYNVLLNNKRENIKTLQKINTFIKKIFKKRKRYQYISYEEAEMIEELLNFDSSKLPNKIEDAIDGGTFKTQPKMKLAKALLLYLYYNSGNKNKIKVKKGKVTLEHIFPKNPIEKDINEAYDKKIHQLTNFTLMIKANNLKAGNLPVEEKMGLFTTDPFAAHLVNDEMVFNMEDFLHNQKKHLKKLVINAFKV